jgi:hypothetical protein
MQDALAILITSLAGGFLLHRACRHFVPRRGGVCSSCTSCSSNTTFTTNQLVAITPIFPGQKLSGQDAKQDNVAMSVLSD